MKQTENHNRIALSIKGLLKETHINYILLKANGSNKYVSDENNLQ